MQFKAQARNGLPCQGVSRSENIRRTSIGACNEEMRQMRKSLDTMQLAVIKTGGKQYLVSPGMKLKIEKMDAPEGDAVVFDEVLLVSEGERTMIGTPHVSGATVHAKVLTHARAKKVIVFKYRPKARHRTKKGHRQHYTEVEITKIISK